MIEESEESEQEEIDTGEEDSGEEDVLSLYDEKKEEEEFGYKVGNFVIVEYEGELFPGEVVNVDVDGSAEVKTMAMRGMDWAWPPKDDQCWYEKEQIKQVIQPPAPRASNSKMSHRAVFSVPEVAKLNNSVKLR